MKALIKTQGVYVIEPQKNVCLQLCASIMSQQLSTKVATVIYNRFLQLFKSKSPKPADILQVPHETLRGIGLSNAKAQYVKNVCHFFIEHQLTDARLYKKSNDEILALLTQIKGVGQWTVEMLLMFTLARPDVFSTGDLGLQKAIVKLYNVEYANQKELFEKMNTIANTWAPYRTYACRYLWRALDMPLIPL
ncbi:DNA-3-methyladenine glycosylase family protein [Niabella hibiscisoli]|uniref:DNA-3-methyladenine glycosylase family protein n=1 Tax=Niabella hibiscisoli TaxID=1825928 RepID=UPI001F102D28|nr:DNA-3-methyladenine glycosylase 2 family protein [Niabella hibiscisoli]MCH5718689.1 DNA-3-methyladenine glycosylase 2 family protein [Niabella hibiscisoli]